MSERPGTYREQFEIPPDQVGVWQADMKSGRPLLWFNHTLHVLVPHPIDVSGFPVEMLDL